MNPYTFVFHAAVSEDTDGAYRWYEDKQHGLGERFLASLYHKLTEIALMPEAFGVKSKKNFREALLNDFPYVAVYKIYVKKRIIYISSVLHEKRHPKLKYRRI